MKIKILLIALIGISFGLKAQNTFPTNGNAGIGTTNPLAELHVEGRMILNQGVIQKGGNPISNTNDLGLYSHIAGNWIRIVSNNAPIRFMTDINDGGRGSNVKMSLEPNGNLGLGIINASKKLDIKLNNNTDFVRISRFSNSGRSQFVLADENLNEIWRVGMTGTGTTNFAFFDGSRDVLKMERTGNLILNPANSVGIGTEFMGSHKLAVEGSIGAREIKVEANGWSDFVFERGYDLPTLNEVEKYIIKKGHLKDIPSAKEVEKNGIYLGKMSTKLLQKIEELTLYAIQQEKQLKSQNSKIERLEKENSNLKSLAERLTKIEKQLENKN